MTIIVNMNVQRVQCCATTQKGQRCKRFSKTSAYCFNHDPLLRESVSNTSSLQLLEGAEVRKTKQPCTIEDFRRKPAKPPRKKRSRVPANKMAVLKDTALLKSYLYFCQSATYGDVFLPAEIRYMVFHILFPTKCGHTHGCASKTIKCCICSDKRTDFSCNVYTDGKGSKTKTLPRQTNYCDLCIDYLRTRNNRARYPMECAIKNLFTQDY